MEKTNHSTVSQAVVKVIQDYSIEFDNVIVFDTDNAEYMKKAYISVLKALFPNSIHIGCLAHIQNLVGDAFRKPFDHVNTFMRAINNMFFHAGARKFRYPQYMKDKLPTGKAKNDTQSSSYSMELVV